MPYELLKEFHGKQVKVEVLKKSNTFFGGPRYLIYVDGKYKTERSELVEAFDRAEELASEG